MARMARGTKVVWRSGSVPVRRSLFTRSTEGTEGAAARDRVTASGRDRESGEFLLCPIPSFDQKPAL